MPGPGLGRPGRPTAAPVVARLVARPSDLWRQAL
ncbi:hypothetical protein SFR_5274 [Streptomyces sp. FR-008]|nr:hypothetical protein SFR_5274 [Streptomyces sp. FR-008]